MLFVSLEFDSYRRIPRIQFRGIIYTLYILYTPMEDDIRTQPGGGKKVDQFDPNPAILVVDEDHTQGPWSGPDTVIQTEQSILSAQNAVLPGFCDLLQEEYHAGRLVFTRQQGKRLDRVPFQHMGRFGLMARPVEAIGEIIKTGGMLRDAGFTAAHVAMYEAMAAAHILAVLSDCQMPGTFPNQPYDHEYQATTQQGEVDAVVSHVLTQTSGRLRFADIGASNGHALTGAADVARRAGREVATVVIDKVLQARAYHIPSVAERQPRRVMLEGDAVLLPGLDRAMIDAGKEPLTGTCDLVTLYNVLNVACFPDQVFRTAWQMTKPGGVILVGRLFDDFTILVPNNPPDSSLYSRHLGALLLMRLFLEGITSPHHLAEQGRCFSIYVQGLRREPDFEANLEYELGFDGDYHTAQHVLGMIERGEWEMLGWLEFRRLQLLCSKTRQGLYTMTSLFDVLRERGIRVEPVIDKRQLDRYFDRRLETEEAEQLGLDFSSTYDDIRVAGVYDRWLAEFPDWYGSSGFSHMMITKDDRAEDPLEYICSGEVGENNFHGDGLFLPKMIPVLT